MHDEMKKPHEPLPLRVGRRIKAERLARGLSQDALATKSSVAKRTVIYAEQGRDGTRVVTIESIANGLDIPVGDLLTDV